MADSVVSVVGNVTRDPELRFAANGNASVNFGVAVNRRWQNRSTQEWEEATSFFNIVAWQQLAENIAETIGKGDRVVVTGRLEQRSWDDKDTGDKRSTVEIVADEVAPSLRWATAVITRNEKSDGGNNGNGQRPQPQAPARPAPQARKPVTVPDFDNEEPF